MGASLDHVVVHSSKGTVRCEHIFSSNCLLVSQWLTFKFLKVFN